MKYLIRICSGPRCKENFSDDLFKEAQKILGNREDIQLERRGCMAICQIGPNVEIINKETNESKVHNRVVPSELKKIFESCN